MFAITANQSTMLGSMPHTNIQDAGTLLQQYPLSIPVWIQLPKRSFKEAMIPQYSEGFPGIQVDEKEKRIWVERNDNLLDAMTTFYEDVVAENVDAFAISEEYAAGLHHALRTLETEQKTFPVLKGQITGPFTFGLGLNDQDMKAVWFDEQYRDMVLKGLTMKALWQVRRLQQYAEQLVIFMDEPILSALGTPAYLGIQDEHVLDGLNEVCRAIQETGTMVGVHCCGNMDWGLLARTEINIMSFDAYSYGEKVALYPVEINAFLERDGLLAFGLVPTGNAEKLRQESVESLKQQLEELLQHFIRKGINEQRLRQQILLTPSCGMGSGSLSLEESKLVLELLFVLSHSYMTA